MKFKEATKAIKGITKLVDSVTNLTKSGSKMVFGISSKRKENASEVKVKEQPKEAVAVPTPANVTLDSASSMKNWLMTVRPNVSPALAETIKGQLYVLSFVQSPAMTGMAVDNLIVCLDKSLKAAADESEKTFTRETFCSMIQNMMFLEDARLTYAINKNKEEAGALLTQAGELLDSTMMAIASTVVTSGAALPSVMNIFAEQVGQSGFFKKLGSWVAHKKEEESKKADYYANIVNMYKTLDRYSPLIGPSILICGMLERYRPMVVSYYHEQIDREFKHQSRNNIELISSVMIAAGQILDGVYNPRKVGTSVQKAGKTIKEMKVENVTLKDMAMAEKRLTADLAVAKKEVKDIEKEKAEVRKQLDQTGALLLARKKSLRESIEALEDKLVKAKANCQETENNLLKITELIKQLSPRFEEIKKMDSDFKRITEKYAVAL